jgi:hypothetical protein
MALPETENPESLPSRRHRGETLVLLLIALGAAWFYFWWAGWPQFQWTTVEPSGYNSMLADAFRAGQLHLKLPPNPALAQLEDPYDPKQYGPYQIMDLSYYRGRYYSYFGIAPVVLLFLPWEAIAGSCLTEQFAAAFFTCASLAVALGLLALMRRRYFEGASGWMVVLGGLVLAFGNFSLLLLEPPYYPQVQMASAWFWQITALLCVFQAMRSVRRAAGWMAAASLACGLSVASRPSYLLGTLLLVPLFWHFVRAKAPHLANPSRRWVPMAVAALAPIAAVGVVLMLYNHARFGSPFDFGMRYQQWGRDLRSQAFLSPGYFWSHLEAYLFSTPCIVRYFPFLLHQTEPVGALLFFPFCWLAALVPAGIACRTGPERREFSCFALSCAMAFAGNLVLLAHYYLAWPRYQLDFQPQFCWLAVVGLLAAGHAWRGCAWKRRTLGGVALLLAFVNILASFCFPSAAPYQPPAKTVLLARLLDCPVAWVEKIRGVEFGSLQLDVVFPSGRAGRSEPIFCTGAALKDLLYVRYVDDAHVQIGLFHEGLGGPLSDPVDITSGQRHVLEIDWGALCPPEQHPVFNGWDAAAVARARTRLAARLDGQSLFSQDALFHYSTPGDMALGRTTKSFGFCDPAFTGRILRTRRVPLHPLSPRTTAAKGVLIDLRFDQTRTGCADPLIACGNPQTYALLLVQYLADGQIRFGVDASRNGAVYSDPIRLPDYTAPHRLAVWMQSPWATAPTSPKDAPALTGETLLFCDDHLLLHRKLELDSLETGETYFGVNPFGASTAEPMFAGRFLAVYDPVPAIRSGQETSLPGCPVSLLLSFPEQAAGRSEPLLVTGVSGAGDLVYVRYLDGRRVQFGFDHWGIGGFNGPPVEVNSTAFHRIEISLGSLYPLAPRHDEAHDRGRAVSVTLDGVPVLAGVSPCHPITPGQIYVGENPIGGSTCGEHFSGHLLLIERGITPIP